MAATKGYKRAIWDPSTPALNSFEDTSGGGEGPLTTDYTDGADGRFDGVLQLGPLLTALDCGAAGGTAANTNRMVFSEGMEATEYFVASRGTKLAIGTLGDAPALTADGSMAAFAGRVTDLLFTRSEAGTEEISVCVTGNNAYQVITAITGSGAAITVSANNESIVNHILGTNTSKDSVGQVFGLGMASGIENIVRSNKLSGSVTMDASAWAKRATMTGYNLTYTGIAWWNNFIYIGSNIGPFYLNDDFQAFQLRIPEAAFSPSANLCKGMFAWSKLGVVIPMERECRWFVGENGRSMGPERFLTNTSPIQGRITAGDANELWGMVAVYNPFSDVTYLCAIRPRQGKEEYLHNNPVSYFPIAKLTDGHECEMVRWAGTKGSAARGTWYAGDDDDLTWWVEGKNNRFPDDTGVTYAASNTWYGTEVRRAPDREKRPVAYILDTQDCSSTETVTLNFTYRDKRGTSRTTSGMPAITGNGRQVFEVPKDQRFWATRFRPQIALARGGTTTATPRVIGDLTVIYEERDVSDVERRFFDFDAGEMRFHADA